MNLVNVFKALGDENRLSIVRSLGEKDLYAEVLAERLSLSPATVTHHLKKLESVGLIKSRKEQYYKVFSLRKSVIDKNILELIMNVSSNSEDKKEDRYEQKVIKNFFKNGQLKEIPVQRKKRAIILRHLLKEFESERDYPEEEVNAIIQQYHEDFCTIRREFIAEKLMERQKGIYRVLI
jgi:ArsR family transcriptional regulator